MKEIGLAEELAFYEPSPEVMQRLGEVSLYAFVGPSGSGKDSIMNWLAEHMPHRFARVVGDASRPPREGEKNGVTYHFRNLKAMKRDLMARRFVQVVPGFNDNFYATRPEQYPTDKIAMMAIQARAIPEFRKLGFKKLMRLLIVPYSDEAWQEWSQVHKYDERERKERTIEAIESYAKSLTDPLTRYILNDQVDKAAYQVIKVAGAERLEDESKAKKAAVANLQALKTRL